MGSVFYIKKILPFSFYYTIFYLFCQCESAVPDLRNLSEDFLVFFEQYTKKFLFCQSNKCLLARSKLCKPYSADPDARTLILGSYRIGLRSLEVRENRHIGGLGLDSGPLRSPAPR